MTTQSLGKFQSKYTTNRTGKFQSKYVDHATVVKIEKEKKTAIMKYAVTGTTIAATAVGGIVTVSHSIKDDIDSVKTKSKGLEEHLTHHGAQEKTNVLSYTVKVSENLQKENPVLTKLRPFVATATSLKDVEVKTKEEADILNSSPMFYVNQTLPNSAIENGKAKVDTKIREFLLPMLQENTKKNHIEGTEELLLAMIQQETGGNIAIINSDPMQIGQYDPTHAKLNDAKKSIELGVARFADMLKTNKKGDVRLTIQAYNMGKQLVEHVDGTKEYHVKDVMEYSKAQAKAKGIKSTTWKGEYGYGDYTYAAKVLSAFAPSAKWEEKVETIVEKQEMPEKVEAPAQAAPATQTAQVQPNAKELANLTVKPLVPTNVLKGKVIVLDPGHGGNDPGASEGGKTEAKIAYEIAVRTKVQLEAQGATVYLTRDAIHFPNNVATKNQALNERVKIGKEKKADLFLSIHLNAATSSANGKETYYSKLVGKDSHAYKFAQLVQKHIVEVFPAQDRGIHPSNNSQHSKLAVLDDTKIVAALVEVGFISNPNERNKMSSSNFQESYANAFAKASVDFFNEIGAINQKVEEVKAEPVKEEVKQEVKASPIQQAEKDVKVYVHNTQTGKLEVVSLEEYLIGVVASEMPTKFDVEALKAQTVAARTKIVETMQQEISKDSFKKQNGMVFNADDTVMVQAYRNKEQLKQFFNVQDLNQSEEYKKVVEAVTSTNGKVLTYNSKLISALFYSSSNGYSEDASAVWGGGSMPYLKTVESKEDKAFEQKTFGKVTQSEETITMSVDKLEKKLHIKLSKKENETGKVVRRTPGRRVEAFKIGGKTFTGVDMREKLDLKSTDFELKRDGNQVTITTKGFGHGVGMSQMGAGAMAADHKSYEDILNHYYPGAKLEGFDSFVDTLKKNEDLLKKLND